MNKLSYWRTRRSLSVQELAKQSRVSPKSIEQIEKGALHPSMATLGKLALALEVAVADLDEAAQGGPPNFVEGTAKIDIPRQEANLENSAQKVVAKPQGLAKPPPEETGPIVAPLPLAPAEGPVIAPLPLAQGTPVIKKLRNTKKGTKNNGNP